MLGDGLVNGDHGPVRAGDDMASHLKKSLISGSFEMSCPKWCAMLLPMVLKTKTAFSAFLAHSVSLTQGMTERNALTPALFPVPVPYGSCFDRMPSGVSLKSRERRHLQKAIHTICMALNFWFSGGKWIDDASLKREPNLEHLALYSRLASLIRSDGLAGSFPLAKSGRKAPELIARLSELSGLVTALGTSLSGYGKGFSGMEVSASSEALQEINPFTDLNAGRLKLYGSGHWNVTDLLSDDLVMAYREPRSLLSGLELGEHPPVRDSKAEILKLAKLWDERGLLSIHQESRPMGSLVKIFNVKKNATMDRQIGDRRGQNSYECRVAGPSSTLPSGADIMDLKLDVKREKIVLMISDRKDYYHQLWTTAARTSTNAVGPSVALADLKETHAYEEFLVRESMRKSKRRQLHGDGLDAFGFIHPGESHDRELLPEGDAYVCFSSFLQGDHTGVEVATDAHSNWLRRYGLLCDEARLVASRCLHSSVELQGLVIDDFFCAGVESKSTCNGDSKAAACYEQCSRAYADAGLLGSPEKDVVAENSGKLIGAFVNSEERTLKRGLCTVGASPEKRIAMSFLTLAAAQLKMTTDSLHLCLVGNWTAMITYRRPLMSVLDKSYKLVDQNDVDPNVSKVIPLSRSVANEMVLLSVLAPLMVSDLGAEYVEEVYSTDASSKKGAICAASLDERTMSALWKSCKSKGSYTRLLTPAQQILRLNEKWEEEYLVPEKDAHPSRPWAFCFDFIEVFSGASLITAAVSSYGITVGPPLDIGISTEYDLRFCHVMEWLSFMIAEKRLKAVMLSPPCTTFSIMRRPRLRSKDRPYGFNPLEEKTQLGNQLGQRAGQLSRVAAVNGAASLMETPYSAYLKHLPGWKNTKALEESCEVRCDSCRFGSPHLKSFRFLSVNMDIAELSLRCVCETKHVKVEGSLTKGSATYVQGLVEAISRCFVKAIYKIRKVRSEGLELKVEGLENQLVNEVSLSSRWRTVSCWTFKAEKHINLLEESAILHLANRLSRRRKPTRAVCLTDSFVVRGATSKGRSSSKCLSNLLRKIGATMVAAALYFTLPYVPTRWNPSDDPTRDVELRPAYGSLELESWDNNDLYRLSELPKVRRWVSLWMRMVLRLLGPSVLHLADRSLWRQSELKTRSIELGEDSGKRTVSRGFDKTLGFPGEGPMRANEVSHKSQFSGSCISSSQLVDFHFWSLSGLDFCCRLRPCLEFCCRLRPCLDFCCRLRPCLDFCCRLRPCLDFCLHLRPHFDSLFSWICSLTLLLGSTASFLFTALLFLSFLACGVLLRGAGLLRVCCFASLVSLSVIPAEAMPMFPKTPGEVQKAALRAVREPVPQGRPVLPATMARRTKLLDEFILWAVDAGFDITDMFNRHHLFLDELNLILERYGRELYSAGKSYAKYAETINAVTSWKPAIRRSLQGAWDFGYSWVRHEPGSHHVAMPGVVMLAVLTTAMMWGWTRFAGCAALMWSGLLRPGELLGALRADLLLPSDGDSTLPFGLLSIQDPKTRYTSARHQTAKIDMADMLEVVELFLSKVPSNAHLWPMSGATLRSRFQEVLRALKLPLGPWNNLRPLELASIRAGAATWVLQTTENGDLLQRRGRWQNRKMMDIYVQEMSALIYLQRVPPQAKDQVLAVSGAFPSVFSKARQLVQAQIPTHIWFPLFQH